MAFLTVKLLGWLTIVFMVGTGVFGKFAAKIKNGLNYHKAVAGLTVLFAVLHLLKVKGVF